MEYCVCVLQELLNSAPLSKLPLCQSHKYFVQLINGLEYLHGQGVIHNDIKPGNLLVTLEDTLKISDFGVAEKLEPFASDDKCTKGQGIRIHILALETVELTKFFCRIASFSATRDCQWSRLVFRVQSRCLECWSHTVSNTLSKLFPPASYYSAFSYNITTGLYPFEGDNIYRLLETIGKGVWSVPEGLDPLLTDLLLNMLRFDANERFTIQKIHNHSWFKSSPINTGDSIPVPPLKGDCLRSSTVLPYLESYHYENRQNSNVFFTEHDLNGKKCFLYKLNLILTLSSLFSRRNRSVVLVKPTNQQKAQYYQSRHDRYAAAD